METINNILYTGEIYMGTGSFTPMDVIFDTGSDWVVVESSKCTNCEETVGPDGISRHDGFDINGSELVTNITSERIYGSAQLKGLEYKDRVCLLLTLCVFDFHFFGIHE